MSGHVVAMIPAAGDIFGFIFALAGSVTENEMVSRREGALPSCPSPG